MDAFFDLPRVNVIVLPSSVVKYNLLFLIVGLENVLFSGIDSKTVSFIFDKSFMRIGLYSSSSWATSLSFEFILKHL